MNAKDRTMAVVLLTEAAVELRRIAHKFGMGTMALETERKVRDALAIILHDDEQENK